jgi:hypothetical protein
LIEETVQGLQKDPKRMCIHIENQIDLHIEEQIDPKMIDFLMRGVLT